MHHIVVYGTLRKNADKNHNFCRFGPQEYLGDIWLNKFRLYSLGSYPFITPGVGSVFAEIHRVENGVFSALNRMEMGAGYMCEEIESVDLPDGRQVKASVWVMNPEQAVRYINGGRAKVVLSGDWNLEDGM